MQIKNISRNALLKRLNRHLQRTAGERLHSSRGHAAISEFGHHFTTDSLGLVNTRHVDPEEWARDLRLLKTDETVS